MPISKGRVISIGDILIGDDHPNCYWSNEICIVSDISTGEFLDIITVLWSTTGAWDRVGVLDSFWRHNLIEDFSFYE